MKTTKKFEQAFWARINWSLIKQLINVKLELCLCLDNAMWWTDCDIFYISYESKKSLTVKIGGWRAQERVDDYPFYDDENIFSGSGGYDLLNCH